MFFKSEEFEAPPGFSVRLEEKHFETELFETDGATSINIWIPPVSRRRRLIDLKAP